MAAASSGAGPGQHDQELLAAPAAGQVAGPGDLAQPGRHHPQDLVAGGVAAGVIDLLEPVDVAEQHREVPHYRHPHVQLPGWTDSYLVISGSGGAG
jgi:hypothetical protein